MAISRSSPLRDWCNSTEDFRAFVESQKGATFSIICARSIDSIPTGASLHDLSPKDAQTLSSYICKFNLEQGSSKKTFLLQAKQIKLASSGATSPLFTIISIIAFAIIGGGALLSALLFSIIPAIVSTAALGAWLVLHFKKESIFQLASNLVQVIKKIPLTDYSNPANRIALANSVEELEDGRTLPCDPFNLEPLDKEATVRIGPYLFELSGALQAVMQKPLIEGRLTHPVERRAMTADEEMAFLKRAATILAIDNPLAIKSCWDIPETTLEERARLFDEICRERLGPRYNFSCNLAHFDQNWNAFIYHRFNAMCHRVDEDLRIPQGVMLALFDEKEKNLNWQKRVQRLVDCLPLTREEARTTLPWELLPDSPEAVHSRWRNHFTSNAHDAHLRPHAIDLLPPQECHLRLAQQRAPRAEDAGFALGIIDLVLRGRQAGVEIVVQGNDLLIFPR